MMDYIKRLRLCIKWFQELEGDYAFEHERLRNALELTEQKCAETGMINFFHFHCFLMRCLLMQIDVLGYRADFEKQGRGIEFDNCGTKKKFCFFTR